MRPFLFQTGPPRLAAQRESGRHERTRGLGETGGTARMRSGIERRTRSAVERTMGLEEGGDGDVDDGDVDDDGMMMQKKKMMMIENNVGEKNKMMVGTSQPGDESRAEGCDGRCGSPAESSRRGRGSLSGGTAAAGGGGEAARQSGAETTRRAAEGGKKMMMMKKKKKKKKKSGNEEKRIEWKRMDENESVGNNCWAAKENARRENASASALGMEAVWILGLFDHLVHTCFFLLL